MKFTLLPPILAALAFATPASPQTPAADFSPDAFRAHVTFLADDLLEGREAGTRGYDLAARYVGTQFEALGLEPAAEGRWLQPIEFVRFAHSAPPRLTVGGRTFVHGREMLVRPSPEPAPLDLEAPIVFAGYGLDLPQQGHDDYASLDVTGRIVVVLNGTPTGTPSDVAAHLNAEKAAMAARRGAAGLIVVRTQDDAESVPWSRYRERADRPGTTWIGRDGQPFVPHALRFSMTMDGAAAAPLFAEAPRSLAQVFREARSGRPRGFTMRQTARLERPAPVVTRFTSPNVVAILRGSDPALTDEYVLLMAHLDGLGIDAHAEGDRIRNGAMDNATGIATLIEVARQMSLPGNRPRRPVLLAAVTAEEKGLLGAEYLARNPVVDGRIIGLVNLDMPILTYNFVDVIAFGAEHSSLGPVVQRAASRMGVMVSPDPLPEEGLFTRSDHYKFVREGVPSVFLMTGFAGGGRRRFAGFLDEQYHSPADDLSQPFDWNAGARFAQLNYLIAREIADAREPPLWYADSFFGQAFGGEQRRAERGQAATRASESSR